MNNQKLTNDDLFKELTRKLSDLEAMSKSGAAADPIRELYGKLLGSLNVETSAAVENARRVGELASLNKIGKKLSEAVTLDEDLILELIYESAQEMMDAKDNFFVALYHPETNEVSFPLVVDQGQRKDQTGDWARRKSQMGLTEFVIKKGKPQRIDRDAAGWVRRHSDEVRLMGTPAMSWLGVPMIAGNEVIGIIAVQHETEENKFDANDELVLGTIASQAAIAIQNARFLKRRIEEFNALVEIQKSVNTGSQQEVLKNIIETTQKFIHAPTVSILLADETLETLHIIASSAAMPEDEKELHFKIGERGMVGVVAKTLQPAISGDVLNDERWKGIYVETFKDTRSIMQVPMIQKNGKLLGAMALEGPQKDAFDNEDLHLLEALAQQAGIAIENQRSLEEKQRTADKFQLLSQIDKAIVEQITDDLDPDPVFEIILTRGLDHSNLPGGSILMYDKFQGDLLVAAQYGMPVHSDAGHIPYSGAARQAMEQQEVMIVSDVQAAGWADPDPAVPSAARAAIIIPLKLNNRSVGALCAFNTQPDTFNYNRRDLLNDLVNHAAIYIQKKEDRRMLSALKTIDQAIIQVKDQHEVLDKILDEVVHMVRAEFGAIALVDPQAEELVLQAWHPKDAEINEALKRVPVGHGIAGLAVKEGRTIIVDDAEQDPRFLNLFHSMHSEIAVPLIDNGQVLGVINLECIPQNAFDKQDQSRLEALAYQTVIGLKSIQRLQQIVLEKNRFQTLLEIGERLGTISDPAQHKEVFQIVLEKTREITGSQQVVIRRYDPATQELVLEASLHPETSPPFERVKLEGSLTEYIFRQGKPVAIDDIHHPPEGVTNKPSDPEIHSMLIVPIFSLNGRGRTIFGSLGMSHKNVGHYSEADIELFKGLAQQLTLTLHRLEMIRDQRQKQSGLLLGRFNHQVVVISHHFGNDLENVVSDGQNVQRELKQLGMENKPVYQYLEKMLQPASRLLQLIEEWKKTLKRDLELLRAGKKLQNEKAPVPVKDYFARMKKWFEITRTEKTQIVIEAIDDNLVVIAAQEDVKEILRNLLMNAYQAMPEGGTVTLKAFSSDGFCALQVCDTGIGIPPEMIEEIFEPGFTSRNGGNGFGLWYSRLLAEENGGSLTVESRVNVGSTFTLSLPKARKEHVS